ncbi:CX module domain-containing protein [Ditylenchus destructor]|uniref:CX module domain-containing protein n=1 Tax=Ditylenchus destructor TaxID=166010 RepID=A0AAD4MJ33_9BILA|nr:CX module domain-containing protein [Ditylenchus destructor]
MAHANEFKNALVGAALGLPAGEVPFDIVTYNGTFILSSPNKSFQYDNRDYYWDREFYKEDDVLRRCSMPFQHVMNMTAMATMPQDNSTGEAFENSLLPMVVFADGTRPKEIVWSCEMNVEICCGIECCQTPWGRLPGIVRFFISVALILIFFGSVIILQTLCRFGCQMCCAGLSRRLPLTKSSSDTPN